MVRKARLLKIVLIGVLGSYALVCALAALFYPYALFPAPRLDAVPPAITAMCGPVAELLDLPHGAAHTHAFYIHPPADGRVVVLFHGNGETMFSDVPLAQVLRERGLGTMLVEYPGYGIAHGSPPTEDAIYTDAEAALAHLEASVPRERVVLWGKSLGTGVAVEMARRGHGSRMVLLAPYTSITDMGRTMTPFLPASLLMRHHFDTVGKAKAIAIPTLVVHGDADEVIPFAMGEAVAKAIAGAKFVRVAGAHHNDLLSLRSGASRPSPEELLAAVIAHVSAR